MSQEDTIKLLMGGKDTMPYSAMAAMGEAPNQYDAQANTWGEISQLGANSPTLAGGLIQGFGAGMKMSKKEKAEAQRDEWRKKTQALMEWDIQNKKAQAELEDYNKTLVGAQQEAQYFGPQLTNGIEEWNASGDTSKLDGIIGAMPMSQKQLKMADGVPQEARFNRWAEMKAGDKRKLMATYVMPDGSEISGRVAHTYDELSTTFGKLFRDAKDAQELQMRMNDATVSKAEYDAQKAQYDAQTSKNEAQGGPNRKLSATEQKEFFEAQDRYNSSSNAINLLNDALGYNKDAFSGVTAGAATVANRIPGVGLFVNDKSATATTNLQNIINTQALENLKASFGSMPTEGERNFLLDLQASVDKTPAERESILKRGIQLLQQRQAFNKQKLEGLSSGNIYQEGSRMPQVEGQGAPQGQQNGQSNGLPNGAVQVGTSGGKPVYKTPDGKMFMEQ